MLRKTGLVFVALMALLQLVYAAYAYLDPVSFSLIRGTDVFDQRDVDWVRIYASRTLFVALIIGYLLHLKQFKFLAAASIFGLVMPITDAYLAYQASASSGVILKHVATAAFLLVTFLVLVAVQRRSADA